MAYKCKIKKKIADAKYNSTLSGYLKNLYTAARRRSKYSATRKRRAIHFNLALDDYYHVFWNQVETLGGIYCAYTGEPMTHKRGAGIIKTNISLDRINNKIGYTKENIIFCTAAFNDLKGQVTIEACQKILEVYKERIGYIEEEDRI